MAFAYPRLGDAAGLELLAKLRAAIAESIPLTELVGFEHPAAEPVATGASVASADVIEGVRKAVVSGLEDIWEPGGAVAAARRGDLDRRLATLLHENLGIVPADAAHAGTWTFLTLVVFPDLAWARFPELHEKRLLGGARNVLRRLWVRADVLGDLLAEGPVPLGEDELVGLFERTALARNRRLVRALAREVLRSDEAPRSEFARLLYKRVTHATGPLMLDVLSDEDLAGLVSAAARGAPWPDPHQPPVVRRDVGADGPRARTTPAASSGDVVLQFHRAVLECCRRIMSETNCRPRFLYAMLNERGGMETARQLVGQAQPSSVFLALAEAGRLDLTFEALVIRNEYRGLFSSKLLEAAELRLKIYGE